MSQQAIEVLLRQKIGLEAVSIGVNSLHRVVRRRMESCKVADIDAYYQLLQTSPQELEQLIEIAIVPETWFFRDREPFAFLSNYVISEWLLHHPGKILRVLSAPCSTGEEPYSIAIALLEAGLTPKNFTIDAVDISQKSLHFAKRAVYRQNSFRNNDFAFRERYFTQIKNEYHLCSSVKQLVNFIHANLLDPYFLSDQLPYDVIFCRNVLIYFDQSAIEKTIQILNRLLDRKGLLFVGHSETGQILSPRFVSMRHSFAFAYRKAEKEGQVYPHQVPLSQPLQEGLRLREKGEKSREAEGQKSRKRREIQQLPVSNPQLPIPNSPLPLPDLEAARKLADLGQLEEAIALCQTYLSKNPMSAEAYVLLGQVHQAATKEEQAEQYFQKAIYLEPRYYEALIHLALLKEHRQDFAGAAILRQRIERLQRKIG
jgi:chemotaxis protein methyltransferase WspC